MQIMLRMDFAELGVLRILQALAEHNAALIRLRPELPLLYDSCVVYKPEADETFSDYLHMLKVGQEDCDALAAARSGELLARGWRALRAGEGGFKVAMSRRPTSIPAQVMLTTRTRLGQSGLYHCIVRYWIEGVEYRDDPSARLGMNGRQVDPSIAKECHLIRLKSDRWRTLPDWSAYV